MIKHLGGLILILFLFISCQGEKKVQSFANQSEIDFAIRNLSDEDYPDNPDIGYRAKEYQSNYFKDGKIIILDAVKNTVNIQFYTKSGKEIGIKNLDLTEYIPTIPENVKSDEYLRYISCINEEWNRNQVKFTNGEFYSSEEKITRIDLARNCLNAYLWEIIIYIKEDEKEVPYAHGWFDFPHDYYAHLFEKNNNIPFAEFKKPLEDWIHPESKKVDFTALRTVVKNLNISFMDSSDMMYPLTGARKKKFKEIIYPKTFKTMKDLQTDSTLFATFTPPGFYNRKDPRTTQLGRFYNLTGIQMKTVLSPLKKKNLTEIELSFRHKDGLQKTNLTIGGLDMTQFPVIKDGDANQGWKNSMGIGNHTFYEDRKTHDEVKAKYNPYYALLTDGSGKWLDSHQLGIDGPIFYFSDDARTILHVWLLSFERHALVGHYLIKTQ